MPPLASPNALARRTGQLSSRAARDPWTVLVAGVGAGTAWATGLPVGAAGLVGAGMYCVATVAGVLRGGTGDPATPEPAPPPPRPGTVQAHLVNTLHDYRIGLERLQQTRLVDALAVTAAQATDAARAAEAVANRVAHAVDAVNTAAARADRIAQQMTHPTQVLESILRMKQRRSDLLAGLTQAVDEIGEVYAKLLELTTTTDLLCLPTNEVTEVAEVSQSLDVIRAVFAELENIAMSTRALL